MPASSSRRHIVLAAVLALSASAHAQQPAPDADAGRAAPPAQRAPAPPAEPAPAAQASTLSGDVADDDLLERSRGGDSRTLIDTRISGTLNGNSATNVSTGWNVIDGNSFANMSGIPIVIQNTGANVLIQNATIINLQLQ